MALLKFDDADFGAMRDVQGDVVKALMPHRERGVEAALVVFALVRCARVMLRLYPEKTQKELLEALIPYLQGEASGPTDSILWTPGKES